MRQRDAETLGWVPRTTRVGVARVLPLLVTVVAFTGCTHMGPKTVLVDRIDYGTTIADSWKEQTLLDIVKMPLTTDLPVFMDVASIVSGYSLQTSVNVGGVVSSEKAVQGSYASVGGQAIYTDRAHHHLRAAHGREVPARAHHTDRPQETSSS